MASFLLVLVQSGRAVAAASTTEQAVAANVPSTTNQPASGPRTQAVPTTPAIEADLQGQATAGGQEAQGGQSRDQGLASSNKTPTQEDAVTQEEMKAKKDKIKREAERCRLFLIESLLLQRLSAQLDAEELWDVLGKCLVALGKSGDSRAVLLLQPAVEAFFLVHKASLLLPLGARCCMGCLC